MHHHDNGMNHHPTVMNPIDKEMHPFSDGSRHHSKVTHPFHMVMRHRGEGSHPDGKGVPHLVGGIHHREKGMAQDGGVNRPGGMAYIPLVVVPAHPKRRLFAQDAPLTYSGIRASPHVDFISGGQRVMRRVSGTK